MRGALVIALLVACKQDKQAAPKPPPPPEAAKPAGPSAGSPVARGVIHKTVVDEGFIVVVPKGQDAAPVVKLMTDRTAKLQGKVDTMAPEPERAEEKEMLAASNPDLTPADLDGIMAGTHIGLLVTGEPIATMRAAAAIARDAGDAAHGWVLDPLAGGAYTAAQFHTHVPADGTIDVRKVMYVHGVQGDNEQPFLDTMGMQKLGFPELTVPAASNGTFQQLTVLIDATAQTLLANGDVTAPGVIDVDFAALGSAWHGDAIVKAGGTGKAHWLARWRQEDGGDLAIELVPPGGAGLEGITKMLDACFGTPPDPVAQIKADDPELKAAAIKARADLTSQRAHFAKGVPVGEHLAIKAPFHDGGLTEWMWVDVFAWKGDAFEGTLDNDPTDVKNVKAGQTVHVKLADVADFLHVMPDGAQTGGYSIEIMKKRGLLR
jgi:uncharacterized protein YegJ (DUF2314 family)